MYAQLRFFLRANYHNRNYYSFKIFSHFCLVKTTHHKFTVTSCCSPNLERIFAILNQGRHKCRAPKIIAPRTTKWHQKCSPLQVIELLTKKTWGQGCVIFGERKNKERNGKTRLRRRKYFEWIIKQLMNSAFVEYEEFCRSRRVLSTSAFVLCG